MLYAMCIISMRDVKQRARGQHVGFQFAAPAKVAESWTGQDSWAAEVDSQEVSLGHDPILLLAGG